jgi:two-component system response regulator NreC
MSHRILIVDDSALIRHSVRACIERNTDWEVCGEAENGRVAIERVKRLSPDVVILDWKMPVMDGLEAAKQIRCIAPSTTMLMITLHDSIHLAENAHAAGIKQVLSKSDAIAEHLVASLREVPPATTTVPTTVAGAERS